MKLNNRTIETIKKFAPQLEKSAKIEKIIFFPFIFRLETSSQYDGRIEKLIFFQLVKIFLLNCAFNLYINTVVVRFHRNI